MIEYFEVTLQIISIAVVIAAAGVWTGAGLNMRPKTIDEQTLLGGTIWSQIIIPIGLLISRVVDETLDSIIEGYYLVTGILLLWITGSVLVIRETIRFRNRKRLREQLQEQHIPRPLLRKKDYDEEYYVIGVLLFLAGGVKLTEFILFVLLGKN